MTIKNSFLIFKDKYASDIRFWIILFFIIRLYGITNAPIEISHSWRQSLTNMIARDFLEIDANILYPRIDMDGNKSGIIATEFPFYNYLIYLTAKLFGYAHWYGRLINLIVSSIGIFYFYKTIKRFFKEEWAFYATMILLSSIWFSFSRKSMPDTFCISLVMIGIYNGLRYCYEKKNIYLMAFFFISSLAILCKIPALYLLSVLVIPLFDKQVAFYLKRNMVLVGIVILLLTYAWYFYWVSYLLETYHYQLYFPKHFTEGLQELIQYGDGSLEKIYFSALQSFIAFTFFIIGLVLLIKQKQKVVLMAIGIATLFFILFIIKTGFVFSTHNYYVIPFVPIMAFVAGFAFSEIQHIKWKLFFIAAVLVEAILNQQHDFRLKESEKYKLTLETIANQVSNKNDLFVINGGRNPQLMYFLHRRGWSVDADKLSRSNYIDSLKNWGCKFLLLNKHEHTLPSIDKNAGKEVFANENFVIYSLVH
jgi:Dolichyl-phosphate-mannose-protein mannosyltransferase